MTIYNVPAPIAAERRRQVDVEGWTPEHDDEHSDGELMKAAMRYAGLHHPSGHGVPLRDDGAPVGWPWDREWWKPKDTRADLVRAGALMLAEHDRLTRAGKPTTHVRHHFSNVVRWGQMKGVL